MDAKVKIKEEKGEKTDKNLPKPLDLSVNGNEEDFYSEEDEVSKKVVTIKKSRVNETTGAIQKLMPVKSKRMQSNRPITIKIQALDMLREGKSKAFVSRALGIAESTLRGWVKEEAKLRARLKQVVEIAQKEKLIDQKTDVSKTSPTETRQLPVRPESQNSVQSERQLREIYEVPQPPEIPQLPALPQFPHLNGIRTPEQLNEWLDEQREIIRRSHDIMRLYELSFLRSRLMPPFTNSNN